MRIAHVVVTGGPRAAATTASDPWFAYRVTQANSTALPAYISSFYRVARGGGNTLPRLEHPSFNPTLLSPDTKRNIEVGFGLGLVGALGLLLLVEAVDNKVRDVRELKELAGVGVAACMPQQYRGMSLVADKAPRSQGAQAVRLFRTNVQSAGIGDALRTLVVTSSGAGEGKTGVATNLAVDYAQAGQRVVLVDADLRKPRAGATFDLSDEPGLTGVLLGDVALSTALRPWNDGQHHVLTSGARRAKPSELMASSKMGELLAARRDKADLIAIDIAPVMPVADTTALVDYADAVRVVVRVGSTRRSALTSTVACLQSVDARGVGVVASGGRTHGGDGCYAPKERRGLLRRSHAVKLLEVSAETVQPVGPISRPPRGMDLRPVQIETPPDSALQDRGRPAGANGSLSLVAWPDDAGLGQDPYADPRDSLL